MLQIVRSAVGQMAAAAGFEEDEVQFIILAVDEACANVIRHAYGGRPDGQVRLSCSASADRLEFILADNGRPPRSTRPEPRALDDVRPGGLGTHLIRSIMNEVEYRFGDNENQLYMSKFVRPRRRVETGAVKNEHSN
jgi:anti-sigma regulatory factor (Ser/Thr protein kinase)